MPKLFCEIAKHMKSITRDTYKLIIKKDEPDREGQKPDKTKMM